MLQIVLGELPLTPMICQIIVGAKPTSVRNHFKFTANVLTLASFYEVLHVRVNGVEALDTCLQNGHSL